MQAVEAVDDGFHGAVETESHGGGAEIIVDGLGHTDDGPAFAVKLQAGGERAIAADDHQCVDAKLVHRAFGFGDDFRRHFGDVAVADFCCKMPFVGASENGSAELENVDRVLRFEHAVITRWHQTFETVAKSDHFPAELIGRTDDAVDHRIESGAIAAAVENSDFHDL